MIPLTTCSSRARLDGEVRSRGLDSPRPCHFVFMRLIASQDAAELIFKYITTCVRINIKIGCITTQQAIGHIVDLHNALLYMLCVKHIKGSPAAMVAIATKSQNFTSVS